MSGRGLKCLIDVKKYEMGTYRLTLKPISGSESATKSGQLVRAAEWLFDLDAQYKEMICEGRSIYVDIPQELHWSVRRAQHQTMDGHRKLLFTAGELLLPLFLDPPNLDKLYPFQRHGVRWLVKRNAAILADDMGLGKTVQVISAIRLLFNRCNIRSALIVCPKTLIRNWEREFESWAPEIGVSILTPPAKIREAAWKLVTGHCHVVLTNYEQIRGIPEVLKRISPDLIVADEAHRLKNRDARVTSGGFQVRAKIFWALTGTPLERDIEDFATILSLVAPTKFGPNDAKLHPSTLRIRARPFVLRRRKEDVLGDLPLVGDVTEILELSRNQEKAYRMAIDEHLRGAKQGEDLALLSRLLTICDMDPDSGESTKLDRILRILRDIRKQKEKAVVFSYRIDPLRELWRRVTAEWGDETGILLIGDMESEKREQAVIRFRSCKKALVLLASSRIGGEGLTLVEANHVFLFNQWWNPSANDQARDRVVRIGQRRNVSIHRFICRGTIEEKLQNILEEKRKLFDQIVGSMTKFNERHLLQKILYETNTDELLFATNR